MKPLEEQRHPVGVGLERFGAVKMVHRSVERLMRLGQREWPGQRIVEGGAVLDSFQLIRGMLRSLAVAG